ncbi:helix-turn-helix transcriptional regulator [Streptomyces paromomycinus]|uniref:LuxR family transcriptional regulator n=1 Tax=Streptomyces paromomycinus TaxID=92743 RepID=A0A401WFA0_STREY|nr:LuxR C-terminal-related transcriptional regulator [Streptomyces paromomycinus]GCD47971.1 LuxR family transcriptional regulator [Streptomyces paromomycinus]
MPATLRTARRVRRPAGPGDGGRAAALRGRLRDLGQDAGTADRAVTACLAWLADLLVEIGEGLDDQRSAAALVDEAAAVLASAPRRDRGARPPAALPEPLTERELTVLRALRKKVSLRCIAEDLFVSHNTVKSHARAVYRKLGAHSRTEALHRARERGLVP